MEINKYYIERDKIISLLKECSEYFSQMEYRMDLQMNIRNLRNKLTSNINLYINTISIASSLINRITSDLTNIKDKKTYDKGPYLSDLSHAISDIYRVYLTEENAAIYNSEKFYTSNISELKQREETLKKEINTLKKENKRYAEIEKQIKEINIKKLQIEEEKEELKKKIDAQENFKKRISDAFDELKKHIAPLESEKTKLNWMFYTYAVLCICILIILVFFECSYLSKWGSANKWIDYLPYYVPVPIIGGLLWAFIYQMNRAQRQLLQLANVLYHIDYVEGLLLAINYINTDVKIASEKISYVLDKMIENYMSLPNNLSERVLDREISKDNINLHTFINLAKEIKDVIK